jgi:hypothetical protein
VQLRVTNSFGAHFAPSGPVSFLRLSVENKFSPVRYPRAKAPERIYALSSHLLRRRFPLGACLHPTCHQVEPASHGVSLPFRVYNWTSLAPVLVGPVPRVLCVPAGLQGIRSSRFRGSSRASQFLSWTCDLLQSSPSFLPLPLSACSFPRTTELQLLP